VPSFLSLRGGGFLSASRTSIASRNGHQRTAKGRFFFSLFIITKPEDTKSIQKRNMSLPISRPHSGFGHEWMATLHEFEQKGRTLHGASMPPEQTKIETHEHHVPRETSYVIFVCIRRRHPGQMPSRGARPMTSPPKRRCLLSSSERTASAARFAAITACPAARKEVAFRDILIGATADGGTGGWSTAWPCSSSDMHDDRAEVGQMCSDSVSRPFMPATSSKHDTSLCVRVPNVSGRNVLAD
jgi:hypothetical protein